ncbi:MAG: VOC family protein [Alphaproteobacteria bacterium]|nr:VOC family protein [Alphaproteobacteria bacterium]
MFDQQVTFLYASNLAESSRFYRNVMGLELVLDQGPCQIFRVAGEAFLGVCQCGADRPSSPGGMIVTFVSDDVDGWYEKLVSRGVEVEAPPALNERFNIYHVFLHDPDGYKLEIQQFRDPAWPAPG